MKSVFFVSVLRWAILIYSVRIIRKFFNKDKNVTGQHWVRFCSALHLKSLEWVKKNLWYNGVLFKHSNNCLIITVEVVIQYSNLYGRLVFLVFSTDGYPQLLWANCFIVLTLSQWRGFHLGSRIPAVFFLQGQLSPFKNPLVFCNLLTLYLTAKRTETFACCRFCK